jgi:hypothetical protein
MLGEESLAMLKNIRDPSPSFFIFQASPTAGRATWASGMFVPYLFRTGNTPTNWLV